MTPNNMVPIGGGPAPIGKIDPIVATPGGNTVLRVDLDCTGAGINVWVQGDDTAIFLMGITAPATDLTTSSGDPNNLSAGDIVDNAEAGRQLAAAVQAQCQVYRDQAAALGQPAIDQMNADLAAMADNNYEAFLAQGPDTIAQSCETAAATNVATMQATTNTALLAAGQTAEQGT